MSKPTVLLMGLGIPESPRWHEAGEIPGAWPSTCTRR